jgi:hypothetical protein
MKRFITKARVTLGLCAIVALTAFAATAPAGASAETYFWHATSLPGKTWDGSGQYVSTDKFEFAEAETTSTWCIGPVQKSGSGWTTPLGWKCVTTHKNSWEHVNVVGEMAVYNPNSGTISSFSAEQVW